MKKGQIGLMVLMLVVGIVIGIYLAGKLFHPGCKLSFKFAPPAIDIDCASAPFETTINFGSDSSERSLGDALSIIADLTKNKGRARVFVNPEVLAADFAKTTRVHPPAGSQGTVTVLQQLVAEANAQDKVEICLVPSGGLVVKLRP